MHTGLGFFNEGPRVKFIMLLELNYFIKICRFGNGLKIHVKQFFSKNISNGSF